MTRKVVNPFTGEVVENTQNVFCPTGQGGGKDPSCGKSKGGSGGKSKGSGKKKTKSPGKMTIVQAADKLSAKGYKLVRGLGTDLKKKVTSYEIETPDGKKKKMTTAEIMDLL